MRRWQRPEPAEQPPGRPPMGWARLSARVGAFSSIPLERLNYLLTMAVCCAANANFMPILAYSPCHCKRRYGPGRTELWHVPWRERRIPRRDHKCTKASSPRERRDGGGRVSKGGVGGPAPICEGWG